jgi:Protein of unknown function (DUF3450)
MDKAMRKKSMKRIALTAAALATTAWLTSSVSAATLQDIFDLSASGIRVAQESQTRVDALASETQNLLVDYRLELRTIEDLKAYNIQKEREIADQLRQMTTLRSSIERATLIDRQILPLMGRMIDVLGQFVANDVPFLLDDRMRRVDQLRDIMGMADVTPSEKFRRVFEAYQIENDYGRTIEAYKGSVTLNGSDLEGTVLRVGRVGLYFQTEDENTSALWNPATRQWEELSSSYSGAIKQGIRIAESQVAPDLVRLPVVKSE